MVYLLCEHHKNRIITDEWDADALYDWRANIEQIKLHAHIEAYLINNRSITEIDL